MDCVGCEKCKLWGKLQTLGIATALKVLFSEQEAPGGGDAAVAALKLERNEVIALVNLLERLSKSIQIYWSLSQQLQQQEGVSRSVFGTVSR
jgi:ERO1-like protein alpha